MYVYVCDVGAGKWVCIRMFMYACACFLRYLNETCTPCRNIACVYMYVYACMHVSMCVMDGPANVDIRMHA
jgi:hypothetical protein